MLQLCLLGVAQIPPVDPWFGGTAFALAYALITTGLPSSTFHLGHLGTVSLLPAPHAQDNYVMREMGYQVARRHARRLRAHVVVFGLLLPLLATLLTLPASGQFAVGLPLLALFSTMLGLLVERWLFFAEATHVVTLYCGADVA